jgi:hypothetical protein
VFLSSLLARNHAAFPLLGSTQYLFTEKSFVSGVPRIGASGAYDLPLIKLGYLMPLVLTVAGVTGVLLPIDDDTRACYGAAGKRCLFSKLFF